MHGGLHHCPVQLAIHIKAPPPTPNITRSSTSVVPDWRSPLTYRQVKICRTNNFQRTRLTKAPDPKKPQSQTTNRSEDKWDQRRNSLPAARRPHPGQNPAAGGLWPPAIRAPRQQMEAVFVAAPQAIAANSTVAVMNGPGEEHWIKRYGSLLIDQSRYATQTAFQKPAFQN